MVLHVGGGGGGGEGRGKQMITEITGNCERVVCSKYPVLPNNKTKEAKVCFFYVFYVDLITNFL